MSTSERHWMEDLIDTDAKALGTYLTLLYFRVAILRNFESSTEMIDQLRHTRDLYAKYFAGRGAEAVKATEAGELFIDQLIEHESVYDADARNSILDKLEGEFYDKFVKAFKRYLHLERIPEDLRELIYRVLSDIRAQVYGEIVVPYSVTPSGTVQIYKASLSEQLEKHYPLESEKIDELLKCIENSGLAIRYDIDYYTFPAPCLSDEILELITAPKSTEIPLKVKEFIPPPEPERYAVRPGLEILEDIATRVFEELGFNVETRAKKDPRRGSPIEVDVWAEKFIADARFSAYVSCKNWNRDIDRPVVDEEYGRVSNLRDLPQLKVIIARGFTEPAKEVAKSDGFVMIELGEKAEAENAIEIYKLIHRTLNELFISMAPPRILEIASKVTSMADELRKIAEELTTPRRSR